MFVLAGSLAAVLFACLCASIIGAFLVGSYDGASPDVLPSSQAIAEQEAVWRQWESRRETVPLRDVTLRVVGDQHYRLHAGPDWQGDLLARLHRASTTFEHEFRIRLVVSSVDEWQTDDGATTVHALHQALARSKTDDNADVVIGFTGQTAPFDRGVAYYYGRCCLVRTGTPGAPWPYEDETVLHELSHLFGAWHAFDRGVMRCMKYGAARSDFDPFARTAILAAREIDFRRGLDWLPATTIDSLYAAWSKCHPGEAVFPPFEAACTEGWFARAQGQFELAHARCNMALALDSRLGPFSRRPDDADLLRWAEAQDSR
jgi:hypothetical protein